MFTRKHLAYALVALALIVFACAAFAGHPVAGHLMVPSDVAGGWSAMGALPFAAGTFKNRITNIQPGAAANTTVTLTLGTGRNAPTLDKLQLTLGGTSFTPAHVSAIRGYIDGREFFNESTGTILNGRRTYLGLAPVATELVLDFTEPNGRSAIEQNLSALPLALMQSCYFEIDIGAATAPTMKALAHFRAPTNNPFIKKRRRLVQSFSAGGTQSVYLPSGDKGGKLVRVWIHEGAAGNITAVQLKARNAIGIEGTRTEIQNDQSSWGLAPQAGVLVLDFIADGNLAGWFDTSALADVELQLTGTAADTYTIFLEYLDPIGRL